MNWNMHKSGDSWLWGFMWVKGFYRLYLHGGFVIMQDGIVDRPINPFTEVA